MMIKAIKFHIFSIFTMFKAEFLLDYFQKKVIFAFLTSVNRFKPRLQRNCSVLSSLTAVPLVINFIVIDRFNYICSSVF